MAMTAWQQANQAFGEARYEQAMSLYSIAKRDFPQQQKTLDACIALCHAEIHQSSLSSLFKTSGPIQERQDSPDFCTPATYRAWKLAKQGHLRQQRINVPATDYACFTVIIQATAPWRPEELAQTVMSLHEQDYGNIEVIIPIHPDFPADSHAWLDGLRAGFRHKRGLFLDPLPDWGCAAARWTEAWQRIRGDYLLCLQPGVELDPEFFSTVNWCRLQAKTGPEPALIVVDHEEIHAEDQRVSPWFYSGWDPDFLGSVGLQPASMLIARERVQRAWGRGFQTLNEWIVESTRDLIPGDPQVLAVPELLLRIPREQRLPARPERLAGNDHGERMSIVIPNKNAAALLESCLEFATSQGLGFEHEVIVVDNGSDDPATLDLYQRLSSYPWFRVALAPGQFNYSYLVNLGASLARNPVLLFLNNDVEIPHLDCLDLPRHHITRPDVGVVGVILHYPDGSIQHAGVILPPVGGIGHVLRTARRPWRPSVRAYLEHPRNFQAVTGACMFVKKKDYMAVDGHNEVDLPVEYNDIDLCLRIRSIGLRVLCVPTKGLIHHESLTRGKDANPEVVKRQHSALSYMHKTWPSQVEIEPFRSLNLRVEECSIPQLRDPSNTNHPFTFSQGGDCIRSHHMDVSEEQIKAIVFDPEWYLSVNADVYEAGVDPYSHYAQWGCHEGRLPSANFQLHRYRDACGGRTIGEANLILDIWKRVVQGQLSMEQVKLFRNRSGWGRSSRTHLEDSLAVHGYLNSEIDLGQAARGLGRALDEARLPTSFFAYSLPDHGHSDEYRSKLSSLDRSRVSITMLPLTDTDSLRLGRYPGRHNILYGIWELSRPPSGSINVISSYESFWTPSHFMRQSLASVGLTAEVIPHPVPVCDSASVLRSTIERHPGIFSVLCCVDHDSVFNRQNPLAAIRAFRRAFAGREDVQLIVKVRGRGEAYDRHHLAEAIAGDPRIALADQPMSRDEIDQLMAGADCFLSLHRAEGIGFDCAKAMALGITVIATNYGGITDFVTPETGYPVDYDLIPVREGDYHNYEPGQVWAEPSVDHAAQLLRIACDHRFEAQTLAARGARLMQAEFSVTAVAAKIKRWFQQRELL